MRLLRKGRWPLPKEASSPNNLKTKEARGPPPLIVKRSFLWLKCVDQLALGHPSWR